MMTPPPTDLFWNSVSHKANASSTLTAPIEFHRHLPGYAPSPLVKLDTLARELSVGSISAKIETSRMGLPAFKILGASWAIYRELCRRMPGLRANAHDLESLRAWMVPLGKLTFVAATDGNHGRAVAHMAKLLSQNSHILVPAGMAEARIKAIESEGATVQVIDGTYDDAIAASAALTDETHVVISDTSWEGYRDVPQDVIDGYSTIFAEASDQVANIPTHIFVQMGVGALGAAAILGARTWNARVVSVEPDDADCILKSVREGALTEVPGPHRSIMAGLNCGIPSPIAWPHLESGIDLAVSVPDDAARSAMRALANAGVVAGETGAAGLAGLLALAASDDWADIREGLALDENSHVMILITEGATDPAAWEEITGRPLPKE